MPFYLWHILITFDIFDVFQRKGKFSKPSSLKYICDSFPFLPEGPSWWKGSRELKEQVQEP